MKKLLALCLLTFSCLSTGCTVNKQAEEAVEVRTANEEPSVSEEYLEKFYQYLKTSQGYTKDNIIWEEHTPLVSNVYRNKQIELCQSNVIIYMEYISESVFYINKYTCIFNHTDNTFFATKSVTESPRFS